ncbi:hypothetical protein [Burkholderia ubonensis]|uniref:hypothetical protein n=1 Tax=Burkholderia ubonensis TaxID=101571 RepID=UPI0012F9DEB9|nr:hypothetical protein [Burkholderia ubonensis]
MALFVDPGLIGLLEPRAITARGFFLPDIDVMRQARTGIGHGTMPEATSGR